MSIKAVIIPHLTNHCIRATLVTVLSEANYVGKHIRSITGHKSDASLDSYSGSASFRKHEEMANDLASFMEIDKENTSANIQAQVPSNPQIDPSVLDLFQPPAIPLEAQSSASSTSMLSTSNVGLPDHGFNTPATFENNFAVNSTNMTQVMNPPYTFFNCTVNIANNFFSS